MSNLAMYLGVPVKKGDLGFEIEVEFKDPIDPMVVAAPGWGVHADGSLRGNGIEFISARPVHLKDKRNHLDTMLTVINKYNPIVDCPRTSVHVHVNCLGLTPTQIMTGLCYAWLVEEILLDQCGPERRGNRFCLSIQKAPALLKHLQQLVQTRDYSFPVNRDRYKYSNVAYHNLNSLGTIEFRGMRGVYDLNTLDKWADLCYGVIHSAARKFNSPVEVFEYAMNDPDHLKNLTGLDIKYDPASIEENFFLLHNLIYGSDWSTYTEGFNTFTNNYIAGQPRARRATRIEDILAMDNPIPRPR